MEGALGEAVVLAPPTQFEGAFQQTLRLEFFFF